MQWIEMSGLILMALLVVWNFSLIRENQRLKKANMEMTKTTDQYEDMKADAKEILTTTNDVKTVKALREKYGLSLLDAKNIVDAAKEESSSPN